MIGATKLTEQDAVLIKELLNKGRFTHKKIADLFGVSREMVTAINTGRRWNPEKWGFELKQKSIQSERTSEALKTGNDFREFNDLNTVKRYMTLTEQQKIQQQLDMVRIGDYPTDEDTAAELVDQIKYHISEINSLLDDY